MRTARSERRAGLRLFFALWPDEGVRNALARIAAAARHDCRGREIPARNLHLTLAFLGDTEPEQMQSAVAAAGRVGVEPFQLRLDQFGFWKQGRERGLLWAGGDTPLQLDALVAGLRGELADAGVKFDAKAFVPHVTLLRDARPPREPIAFERILWQVTAFVLVASEHDASGPLYRIAAGPFGAG